MGELMSGNESIARGAWEAGVTVATGYPGTPSTEILENLVKYKSDIYCEWSPNEKVSFEVAAGASLAGARSICTMKHVGLNVAADPLMTLSYTGIVGGFLAIVADDPGMHSSQNEQDTRQYARFAKIPILEPSNAQEAKDFVKIGLEISEKYLTPVILRSTTRVSHARSLVYLGDRDFTPTIGFNKDPQRFIPIPAWARKMRERVEQRLSDLRSASELSLINQIEWGDKGLGIVTSGITYQYVKEVFPEASILKLGFSYPFPDKLLHKFASSVDRLLVIEELDNFLEDHIKSLGISCDGKNIVPTVGELSPERLRQVRSSIDGTSYSAVKALPESSDLPVRPPVLCPGCPHRGLFIALNKFDAIVTGDIGCYSLGVLPPLSRMDTILCMGGGISMAHGMAKAGEKKQVVGLVGDSTFFHSGLTGLIDIATHNSNVVICIADNRTTAMTGHQDNPGTGKTLMGDSSKKLSIPDLCRACGINLVTVVNPYHTSSVVKAFKESFESNSPSVIISEAPCPLSDKLTFGKPVTVDQSKCVKCGACIRIGCPSIEAKDRQPKINPSLCISCTLCKQSCKFDAIYLDPSEKERILL